MTHEEECRCYERERFLCEYSYAGAHILNDFENVEDAEMMMSRYDGEYDSLEKYIKTKIFDGEIDVSEDHPNIEELIDKLEAKGYLFLECECNAIYYVFTPEE